MRLTNEQCRRLTDAIVKAFRRKPAIERLVRFGLDEDLDAIVGGDSVTDIVYNVIMWAEAHENIEKLVIEARQENPGNSLLKAVSEEVLATTLDVPQEQLEAIVFRSENFKDIEPWLSRMWQCSASVCRIEINGFAKGTGFLLGADLVITNYHVMEEVIDNRGLQGNVVLRFHYKVGSDGSSLSAGIEYYLAGRDWLIAASPIRQWDYALVRINTSNSPRHSNVPWAWLTPQHHTFTVGEPVCIIQHPLGNAQKIALGSVARIEANQSRIYYTVNTLRGSSGAPCINSNGDIVALHQRESDAVSNKGIPFSAILEDLQQKGIWGG